MIAAFSSKRRIFLALVVAFSGCGRGAPAPKSTSAAAGPITVSAAASTKEVVEQLCKDFSDSTDVKVQVNSGGSNTLASQIVAGAPADLFLSANKKWAEEVAKANLAEKTVRLLTNDLVIVVKKGNAVAVHQPSDLMTDKVKKVALAGEKVPAGIYADQSLTKLELLKPLTEANKIVRGEDVRTALSYVERGEAEAGIVYSTDVQVDADLEQACAFDPKLHDEIVYELVLLKHAGGNADAVKLFEALQASAADADYQKFGFSRAADAANASK